MTFVPLAEFIREKSSQWTSEKLCQSLDLKAIQDNHIRDLETMVEVDESGEVVRIHKPKVIPVADLPMEEEVSDPVEIAVNRIFEKEHEDSEEDSSEEDDESYLIGGDEDE